MSQTAPTADDVYNYANQLHISLLHPSACSTLARHHLLMTGRYSAKRAEKDSVLAAIRALIAQLAPIRPN